jgi:hypothetical protein
MNLQHTLNQLFDGMQSVRRTSFLTAAAALALAGSAAAQSHQVGLKMGMNGNGNQQAGAAGALLPTDSAGATAYVQTNWNVLGRWGDNATNTFGTNAYAILDSNGDDTHVSIMWDASGNWSQAGGGTPTAQGSPDGNLMNGYCDSGGNANPALTQNTSVYAQNNNNKPMVFLAGLQAWLATEAASYYDVVVYVDGDATAYRTGEYWVQDASQGPTTGPITNIVFGTDLTTHGFVTDPVNFVTTLTYVEQPQSSFLNMAPQLPSGGGDAGWGAVLGNTPGNYLVFRGLSADSFVLRTEEFRGGGGTLRSPINAIQIIPRAAAPPPPELSPVTASTVYAGGTARFRASAAGLAPLSYQWQKNGSPLSDGGNISGSSSAVLTITGVSAGDVASYTVVVTNNYGSVSASAPLSLTTYIGNSFAEEIVTNNPVAYWRLNDTGDPSTNNTVAFDYIGGFNGTYGLGALNSYDGVLGPQPPAFPGFESGQGALQSANGTAHSWVSAPGLSVFTNTVTMCAWVYPTASEPAFTGIMMSRTTNGDICGFGIGSVANVVGYNWNNQGGAFNFASGISIPSNIWSFVGVVVTPSNATLFVYNANGLQSVTNSAITNAVCGLTGPMCIGDDPALGNNLLTRAFTGYIDEAAVFTHSLPPIEIYNLYKKALHQGSFPPTIVANPSPLALYAGRPAIFTVRASGDPFLALSYQWRKNTAPLGNGGNISGATTPTLTVANVSATDAANYDCVVVNLAGSVTSAAANLAVVTPPASFTAYEAALQTANPLHYWRFNEPAASPLAYDYWGGNIATNDNAAPGFTGPIPPDFPGFETTNAANSYDGLTSATETFLTGANANNNQTNFTIAGWFNAAGAIGLRVGLFGQNDVTEFGFHGQDPAEPTGLGLLGIWTPAGATFLSQTLITPGQWYYTAATGDGSTVNLYLFTTNGAGGYQVAFSSATTSTNNYGSSAYSFNIGGDGILDTTGNYFPGLLDEVALWHRALSAGELSTLFASAIGVTALPPQITAQPISQTLYSGRTATFSVTAIGSATISYQWRKNTVPLSNGGNISGALTATLTVGNVSAGDQASYDVVVNNSAGTATSTAATLSVITPVPGGYESGVIALNPIAYYRLNETTDPTTGTAVANDYWGGHPGTYGVASQTGFNNIPGPRSPDWPGFDASNFGVQMASGTPSGCVTNPFGTLNTNMATFTMWIYPTATEDAYTGLECQRGGSNPGGFGYTGGHLGYTWNNNNGNTWGATWNPTPLVPPLNQWSFVALVVTPTNAITYMSDSANPANLLSATADVVNVVESHGGAWEIGNDHDGATRTFSGSIDEVAIFSYSMTPSQLQQLYRFGYSGSPVSLTIQQAGANVVLTWGHGVLQSASQVQGPYNDVIGANSPYSTPAAGTQQFFRVRTR